MNTDILLDENDDLLIEDGDIVITESDEQHLRHNFEATKGTYRDPRVGFGAVRYLKKTDNNHIRFQRDLKEALKEDGYKLNSFSVTDEDKLKIIADHIG